MIQFTNCDAAIPSNADPRADSSPGSHLSHQPATSLMGHSPTHSPRQGAIRASCRMTTSLATGRMHREVDPWLTVTGDATPGQRRPTRTDAGTAHSTSESICPSPAQSPSLWARSTSGHHHGSKKSKKSKGLQTLEPFTELTYGEVPRGREIVPAPAQPSAFFPRGGCHKPPRAQPTH